MLPANSEESLGRKLKAIPDNHDKNSIIEACTLVEASLSEPHTCGENENIHEN